MKKIWQSRQEPERYETRARRVKEFVRQYRLDQQMPGLANSISRLPDENPSRLDKKALEILEVRLKPFMEYHAKNPFPISNTEPQSPGRFILGRQKGNNSPITAGWEEISRHLLTAGATGWGKTTLVQHLLRQAQRLGIKLFIIDPKDDAKHLVAQDQSFLVIHRHSPLNLLQRPSFLTFEEFLVMFVTVFSQAMWGGE